MLPRMLPRREFSGLYCELQGIDKSDYLRTVFRQALYPHARPWVWLLQQIAPNFFRADYDFIYDVGRLRNFKDYELAVEEFVAHPANRDNPLRTLLRIRVGAGRLRRIVRATLNAPRTRHAGDVISTNETTTRA